MDGSLSNQTQKLQDFLEEWHSGNDIHARTSGSTGEPKEISLPRDYVVKNAKRTNAFFKITKKSRLHSAISFEFIGGKMMIARSVIAGCRLTFSAPELIPSTGTDTSPISLMAVVPAQLHHILNNLENYKNVETFLVGGSAVSDTLWNRVTAAGINAWETYGMTETASHIALRRIAGAAYTRPRFVPLPGVKIDTSFDGRLHITDTPINILTNDIAIVHPDGSFEISGRYDEMIVTGGLKVLPQKLEDIISPFIRDYCEDFFITSLPDEIWTSRIVLACVPKAALGIDGSSFTNKINAIMQAVPESALPKKFRPKEIRILDSVPFTASGKKIRRLE